MIRTLVLLMSFFVMSVSTCLAQPDPVTDCPPGLVCLLPAEAAKLRLKVIDLKEQLALVKARKLKRLGLTMGCGAGVPLIGDTALDGYCGVMWGFRF